MNLMSPFRATFNKMLNELKNVSSIGDSYILDIISDIVGHYLITIVSTIGLILNLIGIKMMVNKSLKHDFYKFLLFKTACDSLACPFGIRYKQYVWRSFLSAIHYKDARKSDTALVGIG